MITLQLDLSFTLCTNKFYFRLSASLPFNGHNIKEMLQKTIDGYYNFEKRVWRNVSPEAKDLIDKLLVNEP